MVAWGGGWVKSAPSEKGVNKNCRVDWWVVGSYSRLPQGLRLASLAARAHLAPGVGIPFDLYL